METASEVKIKRVMITPDIAEQYLKKNKCNRPFNEANCSYIMSEMKRGQWSALVNDIMFDIEGNLINGQHTLTSIVRTGKTYEFVVKTGMPMDAFPKIDTGRVRTSSDVLGANGFANPQAKSAIAKFVIFYKKGKFHGKAGAKTTGLTNTEVLKFCMDNPKIHEAHNSSLKITKSFKPIKNKYVGGLYWIFSDLNKAQADTFFGLYGSGISLTENHPVHLLRQKLILDRQSAKKYSDRDRIAWVILAWNYFRANKRVNKIRFNAEKDDFPKAV